jgi:hypothetical protein
MPKFQVVHSLSEDATVEITKYREPPDVYNERIDDWAMCRATMPAFLTLMAKK